MDKEVVMSGTCNYIFGDLMLTYASFAEVLGIITTQEDQPDIQINFEMKT